MAFVLENEKVTPQGERKGRFVVEDEPVRRFVVEDEEGAPLSGLEGAQALAEAVRGGADVGVSEVIPPDVRGPSPAVVGTFGATPGPTLEELESLGQVGTGIAADILGVTAKAGAGLIRGRTLGVVDPERGELGIPFTAMRAKVAPELGKSLEELGVSPDIANNPFISIGPEFVGTVFPFATAARFVAALRPPSAVARGNVARAIERAAETSVAGGIVGAAEVRQDDETMLENALTFALIGGGLHLTAEVALPVVNFLKQATKFKTITKDLSAEDLHRAFTGREGASPEAVKFVQGLSTKDRVTIAKGVIKGRGAKFTVEEPRFGVREEVVTPEAPPPEVPDIPGGPLVPRVEVPRAAPRVIPGEPAIVEPVVDVPIPREVAGDIEAGGLAFGQPLPKSVQGINLNRVGADYSAKKLIVDTSDRNKGLINDARRGTITHEATREVANNLGMTTDDLLKRRKGRAFNAEEATAARDILNSSAIELTRLQKEVARNTSDEGLVKFRLAMHRHAAIQAEVSGIATEAGRALSAHRIVSREGQNFKGMLDALGGRELTEEMLETLSRIDPTDQVAVNRFIRDAVKPKFRDMIFEVWVNSLLSSPKTHLVNTTSNSLVSLLKIPETLTSAAIDIARVRATGLPKERFFGEIPHQVFGMWQGIKEGGRKGLEAFRTETPSQGVSKLEVSRFQSIPGPTGRIVRLPGRALMAEDEFFKAINFQAELHSLAYRKATTEGKKGQERLQRIAELTSNPAPEMMKKAKGEALYRTFQKELGPSGKALQRLRSTTPGFRYIVPFLRTPTNIVKFGLERTPLNFLRIGFKVAKGDLKGGELSDELARATVGSLIAAMVGVLYLEGKITGGGPKNPGQKATLFRTGWQPYSFKVGDQYFGYGRLEPLGMTVGLTADFMELQDTMSEGERDDVAAKLSLAIAQNLTNKTFMQGLSNAINAISDPIRYGDQWVERFVATGVPRVVAGAARALDPQLKEPEGIIEIYKAQLPFLSSDVLPKRNLWGEPIEIQGTRLERFISPIPITAVQESKIDEEMARLNMGVAMPRKVIKGVDLTLEEYDVYIRDAGRLAKKKLDSIVANPGYAATNDDRKRRRIRTVIFKAREKVRTRVYNSIKTNTPERITQQ